VVSNDTLMSDIANILVRKAKREDYDLGNPIFKFECVVFGELSRMLMTSVLGHLMEYRFIDPYDRKWQSLSLIELLQEISIVKRPKIIYYIFFF